MVTVQIKSGIGAGEYSFSREEYEQAKRHLDKGSPPSYQDYQRNPGLKSAYNYLMSLDIQKEHAFAKQIKAERAAKGEIFIEGQGYSVAPELQEKFIQQKTYVPPPASPLTTFGVSEPAGLIQEIKEKAISTKEFLTSEQMKTGKGFFEPTETGQPFIIEKGAQLAAKPFLFAGEKVTMGIKKGASFVKLQLPSFFEKKIEKERAEGIVSSALLFGAFAPSLVTTGELISAIPRSTGLAFKGVRQKINDKGLIKTDIRFATTEGKIGTIRGLSIFKPVDESQIGVTIARGKFGGIGAEFPTGKIVLTKERAFGGLQLSSARPTKIYIKRAEGVLEEVSGFKQATIGGIGRAPSKRLITTTFKKGRFEKEFVRGTEFEGFKGTSVGFTKKDITTIVGVTKQKSGITKAFGEIKTTDILPPKDIIKFSGGFKGQATVSKQALKQAIASTKELAQAGVKQTPKQPLLTTGAVVSIALKPISKVVTKGEITQPMKQDFTIAQFKEIEKPSYLMMGKVVSKPKIETKIKQTFFQVEKPFQAEITKQAPQLAFTQIAIPKQMVKQAYSLESGQRAEAKTKFFGFFPSFIPVIPKKFVFPPFPLLPFGARTFRKIKPTIKRKLKRQPSFAAAELGIYSPKPIKLEITGLVERPLIK